MHSLTATSTITREVPIRVLPIEPFALRRWRKERWLTQEKLADLLGVTRMTVQRWETGDRVPPVFLTLALERLDDIRHWGPAITITRDQRP